MEYIFAMVILLVFVFAATSVRIIQQSRVGIVERLGKFHGLAKTGVNVIIPFIDHVRAIIDLREQVVDYPPQAVITKDNVVMQIDTVVYYQVTDPVKYVYEIANPRTAIEYLTATTLRNIVGDMDLDQTLTSRDTVNARLRTILDEATDKWGIKVTRVELKNIMPPKDIQDAMEKQMRAERERREAILKAEGEKRSAILRAEGERESEIAKAEGQKQAAILKAQGEAEAILTVQRARAESLKMVFNAIREAQPTPEVVAIRSLEALEKVADGKATKIVVPSDAVEVLGALSGIKGVLESSGKEGSKEGRE
ncbi:MAG TPA: SPFH/Band 7/PHB domain protein [Firmicutes bacterium]|nr:SPFH/Band 7/PHB domain protein [Candidatus Fermentithermobacillaceae bacterium]